MQSNGFCEKREYQFGFESVSSWRDLSRNLLLDNYLILQNNKVSKNINSMRRLRLFHLHETLDSWLKWPIWLNAASNSPLQKFIFFTREDLSQVEEHGHTLQFTLYSFTKNAEVLPFPQIYNLFQ